MNLRFSSCWVRTHLQHTRLIVGRTHHTAVQSVTLWRLYFHDSANYFVGAQSDCESARHHASAHSWSMQKTKPSRHRPVVRQSFWIDLECRTDQLVTSQDRDGNEVAWFDCTTRSCLYDRTIDRKPRQATIRHVTESRVTPFENEEVG